MAAPLAAAAGSPGVGDGGLSWDSAASTPGQADAFILAKRQGGNGTNKDKLDTRITTDPACRGIDPTDRQAKFDCLIGRYHPGQPADPADPPG
jgi:hypothetical protein